MATVTAKLAILGENAPVEQEKDANSLLLELEKGLRSNKVGEQCEAIVRFPRLFEKYPFPIFINSAFLKLGDVFRAGTNNLRFNILRVAQMSEKHLDKIQNVDEFLQRIFYVIHSNHAVARAVTLRTLGSVARIISERKNVHHSIINSLDSHDDIEKEAAIYAALNFTEQSKSFAVSICTKLEDMISGLATPVDMKLKLIPIFQHMSHDPATTAKARQLCTDFIQHNPARDVVMVTLHTLSKLAAKSFLDIPQQVDLLLQYLHNDPRRAVQIRVLKDLHLLASTGPHMWTQQHIQVLCGYIKDMPYDGLKLGALNVLTTLSASVAVFKFQLEKDGSFVEWCIGECCYHANLSVACQGCRLLTDATVASANNGQKEGVQGAEIGYLDDACLALESLMTVSCSELDNPKSLPALKECLVCMVKLSGVAPAVTDRFIDSIITTLPTMPIGPALLMCECLSAISSQQNVSLHSLIPDLKQLLHTLLSQHSGSQHNRLMVSLLTVLFQACVGSGGGGGSGADGGVRAVSQEVVEEVVAASNAWTAYQIGRQAARYGHHRTAARVFSALTGKVSTENYDYWLHALGSCCEGEACLDEISVGDPVSAFMKKVTAATNHYQRGLAALKASVMPGQQLGFQCEFVCLRLRQLAAYVQLVAACCSFQTSPPPAIASSLAVSTGDANQRFLHVLQQVKPRPRIIGELKKCGDHLETLCTAWGELYQAAFDADPITLTSIQILQQSCQVIIYVLKTILDKTKRPSSTVSVVSSFELPARCESILELQPWVEASQAILAELQEVCNLHTDMPLSHEHMQCVINSAAYMCSTPLCFPRYFFQRLQHTDIKLAISPQAKSNMDPIPIHYDTHLTLSVEGIIQHGGKAGLFRKVKAVQVSVKSSLTTRSQSLLAADTTGKSTESVPNDLCKTTEPHNDYFRTQFLLSFPVTGIHQTVIEVGVVDEHGAVWKTGPRQSVNVKSYDEAVQRQQQQQFAAQRQQQRAETSAVARIKASA